MQHADAGHEHTRANDVASPRRHAPKRGRLIPVGSGHFGVEANLRTQAEIVDHPDEIGLQLGLCR